MASELPLPTIEPPIFVFSDTLESFDSVDDAASRIEPWDVAEVTEAFDARGRRLLVTAEGVVRTRHTVGGGRTLMRVDPSSAPEPVALAAALGSYVSRVGPERFGLTVVDPGAVALIDLVRAVHRRTGSR